VGRPYPELYKEGLGFPSVKLEVEFVSPVHYGDQVRMGVTVEGVGRSSVTIGYEATVDGRPVFRGRNTSVIVDMETFRPVPIPDWLRARFEAACQR
jgi:acyl-CoA thioesterase FadM